MAHTQCQELRDALRLPSVYVPLQEYLWEANLVGVAFVTSRSVGLSVFDDGDDLIISMGEDTIHSVERPLGEFIASIIPRYCRYMMERNENNSQPPVP